MDPLNHFHLKTFGTVNIVNDNVMMVLRSMIKHSQKTIFFDPPFRNVMAEDGVEEHVYYSILTDWAQSGLSMMSNNGRFISMNYDDGAHIVKNHLIENGLYLANTFRLKLLKRPGRKNDTLYIHIFTKEENINVTIDWYEKIHRPGERKIIEAPRTWVIERIFNHIGLTNIGNVLDMFGGSGNIPHICKVFNIDCTSVEILQDRFNQICSRLEEEHQGCTIATCNRPIAIKKRKLCSNHYNTARLGNKNSKQIFLGLDKNFNAAVTSDTVSKEQLIELSHKSIQRVINERKNRTVDQLGGSSYRCFGDSEQNLKREESV